MSWLWGNETTEQAQIVVSALQGELDEREAKIKALEAALRREQQDLTSVLQDEVQALEARRARVAQELAALDALIKGKQKQLARARDPDKKKKKKGKKPAPKEQDGGVLEGKGAAGGADVAPKDAAAAKKAKKKEPKPAAAAAAAVGEAPPKALPMDENLAKVAKEDPNVAFIIQRSTNANTVVYAGAKAAGDGSALEASKPLSVYWIMYEKAGHPREELTMIERNSAYGATCAPAPDAQGRFKTQISALRDRDVWLLVDAHGNVQALTTIAGTPGMLLRRVFVQMTTSWGIPTVDYVEIFGLHPATLEPVYEKKKNK